MCLPGSFRVWVAASAVGILGAGTVVGVVVATRHPRSRAGAVAPSPSVSASPSVEATSPSPSSTPSPSIAHPSPSPKPVASGSPRIAVVDTAGHPLAHYAVETYPAGHLGLAGWTDSEGIYTFSRYDCGRIGHLLFGPYDLDTPSPPGPLPAFAYYGGDSFETSTSPVPCDGAVHRLVLQPGGVVYGQAADDSGAPEASGYIYAYSEVISSGFRGGRLCTALAVTDADGNYEIAGLPPGDWQIYVSPGDKTLPAVVRRGERTRVDIHVPTGARLERAQPPYHGC